MANALVIADKGVVFGGVAAPPILCSACVCPGARVVHVVGMIAQNDAATWAHLADAQLSFNSTGSCGWAHSGTTGTCFSIDAQSGQSFPIDCNQAVNSAALACRFAGAPNADPFVDSFTIFITTGPGSQGSYCYVSTAGPCPQDGNWAELDEGISFGCEHHLNPGHSAGSISVT